MKNNYTIVNYKNKEYIVAKTNKNEIFVIDNEMISNLRNVNYYLNNCGYICGKKFYLHNEIMNYTFDGNLYVDHINRIKTDNRISNLRLVTQSDQNKNQSKKKRNVNLPLNCNINPEDIPTFIWYIKENGNHGDRWCVEIKNKYYWKTTSSKKISTKCKFELAKKHLNNLIKINNDLFKDHSINGELSTIGKILKQEYIDILRLANYDYDYDINIKNYLQQDFLGLNESEIQIVNEY
jgi:hypothetical protein